MKRVAISIAAFLLASAGYAQDAPDPLLAVARVFDHVLNTDARNIEIVSDDEIKIDGCNFDRNCNIKVERVPGDGCAFRATFRGMNIREINFSNLSTEYEYGGRGSFAYVTILGRKATCGIKPGGVSNRRSCSDNLGITDVNVDELRRTLRAMAYIHENMCAPLRFQPF